MPLSQKAKERKYGYDQEYLKQNITKVSLTFNKGNPDDMMLAQWLRTRPEGCNRYIKRLMIEDIERSSKKDG